MTKMNLEKIFEFMKTLLILMATASSCLAANFLNSTSNDFVSIPSVQAKTAVALSAKPFTLSAWVNPSDLGLDRTVIAQKRSDDGTSWALRLNNGRVVLGMNNDAENYALLSVGSIQSNHWAHIAATYDGTMGRVWINGVEGKNKATTMVLLQSSYPVTVGRENLATAGTRPFIGKIDEVRVWSRALSTNELVLETVNPAALGNDGLTIYLPFDDLTTRDQSGNLLDGSIVGNLSLGEYSRISSLKVSNQRAFITIQGGVGATIRLDWSPDAGKTWNMMTRLVMGSTSMVLQDFDPAAYKFYRLAEE